MSKSCVVCAFEGRSWGGRRRHQCRASVIEATGAMLAHQQRCQDGKNGNNPRIIAPTLHPTKLSRNSQVGKDLSAASFLSLRVFRDLAEAFTEAPAKPLIPRAFQRVMSILPPRHFP